METIDRARSKASTPDRRPRTRGPWGWVIPLVALALGASVALVLMTRAGQQVPFSIRVAPSRFQLAIPGQRILVLVSVENQRETDAPVDVSAWASGATVRLEQPSVGEAR